MANRIINPIRTAILLTAVAILLIYSLPSFAADLDWQKILETGERCSGLSRELILSVIWTESSGNPNAVNVNGVGGYQPRTAADAIKIIYHHNSPNVDLGLMQVNWKYWGREYGLTPTQFLDPVVNVCIGSRILRDYIVEHKGSWRGVGRYNASSYDKQVRYALKVNRTLTAIKKIGRKAGGDSYVPE